MDTLDDCVFLGCSRLEFCHEPPTVGGSRSSLPLLRWTSLSQSHAIWFLLPLLDQLGRMAGTSFPQSRFLLSQGQPETGEWEKLTVQFYQERGHFADTQVGSWRANGALLTSPLLCRPSSRLSGYQVLSVSRISWFSCFFTSPQFDAAPNRLQHNPSLLNSLPHPPLHPTLPLP